MGLIPRLFGERAIGANDSSSVSVDDLADGALDTLSNIIRVMGNDSFQLESDIDAAVFPQTCADFACHVENGAAVPSHDLSASVDGRREWARVRRFFADRRRLEKVFVTDRLQGYRGIVDDLVAGLRDISIRDLSTENRIIRSLSSIENAVETGALPQIREALAQTVAQVSETFAQQKREYEKQLGELNDSMSNLRQDLVAAREEMKRDSLTEAYNRGAFDSAIVQSLNMHFISRQPVTLLIIDLDNFKKVNDNHGHAIGDAVLRAMGECLARSFMRKNDLIARFGGDEFAIILPDTTANNAESLIFRCLERVRSIEVASGPDCVRVSCSIGYTEIVEDDSAESFIKRADKALYRAKDEGRDRSACITANATRISSQS